MDGPESVSDGDPPPDWIRSAEACRITELSRQQVENLIRSRKFPAQKNAAGHWRINPEAVRAYAPGAYERKARRRTSQRDPRNKREPESSAPDRHGSDPVMQELARLRARVRLLEDELAYEQQAAENRWTSEDAREKADRHLEDALLASREARKSQVKEIRALEERIGHLRGPGHPGDLFNN